MNRPSFEDNMNIADLKKPADLKEYAKTLDPENDEDVQKFFLLQNITKYYSKVGASADRKKKWFSKGMYTPEDILLKQVHRKILPKYKIPRCDWKLWEGVGGYKTVLDFFNKHQVYLLNDYTPKHDTVILRSCTATKPYRYTKIQNNLQDYDWAVCSYNIVPKRYNEEYPFAFYCGTEESEGTTLWERLDNKSLGILRFLEAFEYKKVIDYTRPVFYATGKTVPSPLELIKETNPDIPIGCYVYEKPIRTYLDRVNYYSRESLFLDYLKQIGA